MSRFFAFLAFLAATPVAAQSNAERILNDRYTRSHDYDLIHQRIELRAFDWDSLGFEGRVTTTLVSLRPGLDSVILDAGRRLEIRSVTAGRRTLRFDHRGDTLVVRPARAAGFGDTVRFAIAYRARIDNGRGLTFIRAEPGRAHRPQQIWSMGQTNNNRFWFPTYDFPNDKTTWELVATVPAGFTAVSNGRLVSDRRARDGARTMHWSQEKPSSTYLISLVVAPLVRIRDRWRDVPVDYYVYPQDSALARPLFGITVDQMEVFSRLTGVKYPWAKYAQVTVADFFGGMEHVSASTMVDWLPDPRAYVDRPWYHHVLIAHELAHQWFGDLVTVENWANMWLNEGFAEFMPGRYWGEKQGPHAAQDYYLDEYHRYLELDARRRMPLASLGSNNIYPKGALVLEMLYRYLGPERFWAAANRFLTRHAYDNAVSDDFRQAVLDATGENLAWFWDQWVYAAGHPELEVAAEYRSAERALWVTVRQTQGDTIAADSAGLEYTVPAVFRMPLTIRVGTAGRDVVKRVQLDAREQTFTVEGLAGPPTMVIFDDDNAVLKTLAFEQPTPWLATMLDRAAHLWNREWAITQLAGRTDDSLAGAALARAAVRSDHPRTRATAANVLTGFAPEIAAPALRAAAADTSASVREAALGALSVVAGPAALPVFRRAWRADTSYRVRAAALAALVRLDSTGRRDLLRDALAMRSYRNVIRQAALVALVQHPDSALVGAVEELLGEEELAALALGALGASGDPTAREAFGRGLNDERAWVRRWIVAAFRRAMPPAVATAWLRSLRDGLQYADTRTAVDALIEQLGGGPAPSTAPR